jgi:hypothetical protein
MIGSPDSIATFLEKLPHKIDETFLKMELPERE